jgi:antitoxin VapB
LVTREGDAVILRPRRQDRRRWNSWRAAVDRGFRADFLANGRQQPDRQSRSGLDDSFG